MLYWNETIDFSCIYVQAAHKTDCISVRVTGSDTDSVASRARTGWTSFELVKIMIELEFELGISNV